MSKMKFEYLPNEILFQCFHYLNMIDIFHSFDQLNYRFNSFIRSIPFCLSFENIKNRFQCEEFSQKLSTDETLKNQLYSLHLSNENTCYPIRLFLSKFSLLQFPHLHSITLHEATENNWISIRSTLSLLPNLSSFRMTAYSGYFGDKISFLPMSQIHTLIIDHPSFEQQSIPDIQFSSIKHLWIDECSFDDLFILLANASKLHYLKINYVRDNIINKTMYDSISIANNLKILHFIRFESNVDSLFMLLRKTPNLVNLTLLNCSNLDMINASKWHSFKTFSLSHLKNFQFMFYDYNFVQNDINKQVLNEFQNGFWFNERQWHTEYILSAPSVLFYTTPYPLETFLFDARARRFYNQSMDPLKMFANVKYLSMDYTRALTKEQHHFYFSKVHSLSFRGSYSKRDLHSTFNYLHLKNLQTMVNLPNIKSLEFWVTRQFKTLDILKELLKLTTQLTSLRVNLSDFMTWLNDDDELCKYINKSIRRLHIFDGYPNTPDQQEHVCKIFSNLETLVCSLGPSDVLFLIQHLPKLTYIENIRWYEAEIFWFKQKVEEFGFEIIVDFNVDDHPSSLFFWINRN